MSPEASEFKQEAFEAEFIKLAQAFNDLCTSLVMSGPKASLKFLTAKVLMNLDPEGKDEHVKELKAYFAIVDFCAENIILSGDTDILSAEILDYLGRTNIERFMKDVLQTVLDNQKTTNQPKEPDYLRKFILESIEETIKP